MRMLASAAAVVAIMPLLWISSAAWSTALAVGLVTHEVGRRLKVVRG